MNHAFVIIGYGKDEIVAEVLIKTDRFLGRPRPAQGRTDADRKRVEVH